MKSEFLLTVYLQSFEQRADVYVKYMCNKYWFEFNILQQWT
jgi:hypothetical protein